MMHRDQDLEAENPWYVATFARDEIN